MGFDGARLAVLLAEPAVYRMARMAAILAEIEGASVGVFYGEDEALVWLAREQEVPAASTGS